MERRKFLKSCCMVTVGVPFAASILQSCGSIYYANTLEKPHKIILAKSEFWNTNNNKKSNRSFVLVKTKKTNFPICVNKIDENTYNASLLECTHRGCELNVGGGIYSCPCHGSEFTLTGKVLEGPADRDLKTFNIETNNDSIYILL